MNDIQSPYLKLLSGSLHISELMLMVELESLLTELDSNAFESDIIALFDEGDSTGTEMADQVRGIYERHVRSTLSPMGILLSDAQISISTLTTILRAVVIFTQPDDKPLDINIEGDDDDHAIMLFSNAIAQVTGVESFTLVDHFSFIHPGIIDQLMSGEVVAEQVPEVPEYIRVRLRQFLLTHSQGIMASYFTAMGAPFTRIPDEMLIEINALDTVDQMASEYVFLGLASDIPLVGVLPFILGLTERGVVELQILPPLNVKITKILGAMK